MKSSYILQQTSNGAYTLIHKKDNKEIRLHSAYNPQKEAERATSGFSKGRASVIAVSGLGLGYHVNYLQQLFPETPIIVIEHDMEVVRIVKKQFPDHIRNIPIIQAIEDLPVIFEQINMSDFRGVAHYVHRPAYLLHKDFYDSVMQNINQYISSKISDLLTRFEFEEKWVTNILQNIPHIFSGIVVHELFGKFKQYPGIIVSAGPSLRNNGSLLKEMQDKALIVAVDTSLKVLQKMGITPHIVMTLDAQKYSLKHFLGLKNNETILLSDLVSYPAVVRTYQGTKIYSTTSKYYSDIDGSTQRETTPLMDWVENYIPHIGDIQSGGSVATSAFDLLLNLGCDPIVLAGQDLAYTGREIHCSGTYHNDDWLTKTSRIYNLDMINQAVIRKRKIKHVEAYGGKGTVISDFVFDLYKGWFEDSAAKVPVSVINATEGGAKIQNTSEKSLAELAKKFKQQKKTPHDILHSLPLFSGEQEHLNKALESALKQITSLQLQAQNILDNKLFDQADELFAEAEESEISRILNPFLRKTRTYLSRHEMDMEKACSMYLADIISATEKIIPQFQKCSEKLKSM